MKLFFQYIIISPFLALLWVIAFSPNFLQKFVGIILGNILYYGVISRRKIAFDNISSAFPNYSKKQKKRLCKKSFMSMGYSVVEMSMSWFLPIKTLQTKIVIKGEEYIDKALKNGQGVIIVPPHYCNIETIATLISVQLPVFVTYYIPKKSAFYHFLDKRRNQLTEKMVDSKNLREMLKVLKKKAVLWYSPDQSKYESNAPYVLFFGKQVKTTTGTSKLAKIAKAQVLPIYSYYDQQIKKYIIEFYPPLTLNGNPEQDTRKVNQAIEQLVYKKPEQYMWVHKRFKDTL